MKNAVPVALEKQLNALDEMNRHFGKPLLIQHFEVNEKTGCAKDKEDRCIAKEHQQSGYHTWHPWKECKHEGWPIFHRSVLQNELLLECDDPPANTAEGWASQRKDYNRIIKVLRKYEVAYQLFYGGKKRIHLHLLLHPLTPLAPDDIAMS